jgi:hypothetical protein
MALPGKFAASQVASRRNDGVTRMDLNPRDKDKLLIAMSAVVERRRLELETGIA